MFRAGTLLTTSNELNEPSRSPSLGILEHQRSSAEEAFGSMMPPMRWDVNGDGVISEQELVNVMQQLCPQLSSTKLRLKTRLAQLCSHRQVDKEGVFIPMWTGGDLRLMQGPWHVVRGRCCTFAEEKRLELPIQSDLNYSMTGFTQPTGMQTALWTTMNSSHHLASFSQGAACTNPLPTCGSMLSQTLATAQSQVSWLFQ